VNHTFGAEKMDGTLKLLRGDFAENLENSKCHLLNTDVTLPAITQASSQVQS